MTNADSYPSVNLGYGSCPSSSPTRFPKTATFPVSLVREKIMGPNPLKLCEELLTGSDLPHGSRVCDLGSGTGITSALLAREYDLDVYAVDLWSDPAENRAFFDSLGIPVSSIHPVKADASRGLPFCAGFFDAVVSIDSYNYYGRDSRYLDERLLPYVRTGGELHLSIPGMVHDCHDDLPSCLLASWTPEQLEYMHDMAWWKRMLGQSPGAPSSRPVPSNSPEKLDERHTTSETLTIETTPPPDISSATVGSAGGKAEHAHGGDLARGHSARGRAHERGERDAHAHRRGRPERGPDQKRHQRAHAEDRERGDGGPHEGSRQHHDLGDGPARAPQRRERADEHERLEHAASRRDPAGAHAGELP